jgi:predicted  nucleic acid-binding Zn-ribbon protein
MTKNLFTILLAVTILFGCQTIDAVIADAQRLQTDVVAKVEEVRIGIDNVVTDAKDAYEALIEKKRQLEEMVAQINAAVEAVNKLLGKDNSPAETEDLQTTINELQQALAQAEVTLNQVQTAEENLEIETPPADEEETPEADTPADEEAAE